MKIICDKITLKEAVTGVSKAVMAKSSVVALEGILLKAEGMQLTLTGYDLEMAITTTIECNVIKSGEIVINSKLLCDMVNKLICEEVEIIVDDNNNITINGDITTYNILGIEAAQFPALPNPDVENTVEIEPKTLQEMVNSTIYAVATDDKRPAHTGELLIFSQGHLKIVALDGFRLAITDRDIVCDKDIKIIVPQKTMHEAANLICDSDENILVNASNRFVIFSTSKYKIISRLIEGEFLDFEGVIPKNVITSVTVEVKKFIEIIERASLIITERLKNPLRIYFNSDGLIEVKCKTALGSVEDEINAQIEGDGIEIGFNYRYLLDALRNSGEEKVKFEINGALNPIKIKPIDNDNFLFLVLPVRFKND